MNKRMWITLICGLLLVVLHVTGKLTQNLTYLIGGFAFVALFLGSLENEMRFGSPQLVSPTVHSSVDLESILKVGDWCAVPIGTIKNERWNIFTKGGQGTVIFRKASNPSKVLYRIGGGHGILLAEPVPKGELDIDPDLRAAMAKRGGFKPPYYIADRPLNPKFTFPPKSINVDVGALVKENQALKRQVNILDDAYRGKTALIDREIARISGAARSLGISRWQRYLGRSEERGKPPTEE